jgi:NAD(P)-dependent dehydrogenase (short-subunit alcohol dehydrogenase family)
MVRRALAWQGRIDVLIHSAGICKGVPFLETGEELWDTTLDTNLKGAFLVSRAVVPHMIERGRGSLVFIASTNSCEGEMLQAPYNASKGGLYLLMKTLARELGPYGIRSNAVGPGFIRTRLSEPFLKEPEFIRKYLDRENPAIPLCRLGLPEDVTGPALFLASRDAAFVNGALLLVDGGQLA